MQREEGFDPVLPPNLGSKEWKPSQSRIS
jgi:hypothetical protein